MTLLALRTNSTLAASAMFAIGAFQSWTGTVIEVQDYDKKFSKIYIAEDTETPKIMVFDNKDVNSQTKNLFPNISGFTQEEAGIYEKAIAELFVPTGRNLFDL